MKKTIILIAVLNALVLPLMAQNSEAELKAKADELFEQGKFVQAHPIYSQLVSLHPRNEDYNWRFGASTIFSGSDYETALKHLKFASQKATVDSRALYYLGLAHQLHYDFDEAVKAYANFKNLADASVKSRFDVNRRVEQCNNGKGLLKQVKDLLVLDKTPTKESDFFRFFNLEGLGGKILAMPEDLKTKEDIRKGGNPVIYYPGSASVIYFASYGKDGANGKDLYRAYILPGGKFSNPEKLKGSINTPYDEDYAFMHPDGKTFYFASKGHNSMGGYDIFRSIYDEATDQFLQPVNLDFAINTPDDDIMFVTDSAQHLACFASGRSSAMGELHVYKVRVQGIPVQAVFIQGLFASAITPDSKKAKIQIVDELSGRTIESTFSSIESGEYILQLPKSGKYRIEVEGEGSPIVHEAEIDIPQYGEPVVLRQEMKLVKENGIERLQIINHFDEPLTDRIAEYTAMLMRKKAGLDVNASEEDLAPIGDEQSLTVDLTADNAPQLAGFPAGTSIGQLVTDLDKRILENEQEVARIKEKSEYAAGFASQEEIKGKQLMEEAKVIRNKANPEDKAAWLKAMTEYQTKVKEAESHFTNAAMALQVSQDIDNAIAGLQADSEYSRNKSAEIKSLISSGETAALVKSLSDLKDSSGSSETKTNDGKSMASAARQNARKAEDENRKSGEKLSQFRAEESSLEVKVRSIERRMESASNKEKASLQTELKTTQSDLEILRDNIQRETGRFAQSEQARQDFQTQADIIEEIVIPANSDFSFAKVALNPEMRAQKQGSLKTLLAEAREMEIKDAETLALIDSETRVTSRELLTEAPKRDNLTDLNVEMKPVSVIRSDFDIAFSAIPQGLAEGERSVMLNLISSKTVASLDLRENRLQSIRTAPGADIAAIDKELLELAKIRAEVESKLSFTGEPEPAKAEKALASVRGNRETIDFSSKDPATQISQIQLRQENLAKVALRKSEVQQQILQGGDAAALKPLLTELEELNAFLDLAAEDAVAMQDAQNAFTSAFRAESNPQRQEQLREEWTKRLEALKQSAVATSKSANPEFAELNTTIAMRCDEYILAANALRVNEGAGDLALAREASNNNQNAITESKTPVSTKSDLAKVESQPDNTGKTGDNTTRDNQNIAVAPAKSAEAIATSGNDTGKTPVDVRSKGAAQSGIAIGSMPREKSAIVVSLVPEYPLEMLDDRGAEAIDPGVRLYYESALKDALQAQVRNHEVFLASGAGEAEKSAASEELTVLLTLKRQSDLRVMDLEGRGVKPVSTDEKATAQNVSEKPVQAPIITMDSDLEETFEFVLSPSTDHDAKDVYQSEAFNTLIDRNEDVNIALRNLSGIAEINQEIADKETAIQSETSSSKQRKLDRQIEDLYARVGEMEIGNAPKIRQMAEVQYAGNSAKIDELEERYSAIIDKDDELETKYDQYLSRAEVNMNDARKMRENASRIADPIEKNYRLREAFVLEAEALEYQEKCIAMLENAEQLVASKEQYLALQAARESKANAEAEIAELRRSTAQEPEETVEADSQGSTGQNIPVKTEEALSESSPDSKPQVNTDLADNEGDNDITAAVAIPEKTEYRAKSFDTPESLINKALLQGGTDAGTRADIERSEAYADYRKLIEEARRRQNAMQETLNSRSGLIDELEEIDNRIAVLNKSLATAGSEAEKEGIREEIKQLRAQADVLYARITALDEQITAEEKLMDNLDLRIKSKSEDILRLARGEEPAAISEPAVADAGGYFVFPAVLKADLFDILGESPYGEGRPIPIDAPMPMGLIFKVQVGAFRNPIPADHFGGFAPLRGERIQGGLTRYTAGIFLEFNNADEAKKTIRSMGYSDAFVVAYFNGKRIPLYEAFAMASDEPVADSGNANSSENTANRANANAVNNPQSNQNADAGSGNADNKGAANGKSDSNGRPNQQSDAFSPDKDAADYYTTVKGAAEANQVEVLKGLFYTVQVGVYSKPVPAKDLYNIAPLNSEKLSNGKIRYTTGVYNNLPEASVRKDGAVRQGVYDAFVTAYYNGKRISLSEAEQIFAQSGPAVLAVSNALGDESAKPGNYFEVYIGTFSNQVPADIAKAMLYMEETRGIERRNENNGVSYYTGKLNSLETAKIVVQEFSSYGVTDLKIVEYRNGVRVSE